MEQIVAERPFDQWKTLTAPGAPAEAYIDAFYKELTAKSDSLFGAAKIYGRKKGISRESDLHPCEPPSKLL